MNVRQPPTRKQRLRRMLVAILVMIVGAVALPLGSYAVTDIVRPALAQAGKGADPQAAKRADPSNPRANFWRGVRESAPGYTAASGPYTTNEFIQNGGQNFRMIRNGWIAYLSPWVLAGVLLAIALYHFLIGPQRVEGPVSERMVKRWSIGERAMHWYVAVLFIVLGITGLSLLFGRAALVPVTGLTAFSAYATFCKALHNYLGPFFMAGVLVEVIVWVRYNLFSREDLAWLARAGGMFGGAHPHAGRTNGGEKVWFWYIATAGLIGVCVTGLILDFPNFGQTRGTMQVSQLLHATLGTLWIAIALGHIYLGVWGTPGALQGMTHGYVTEAWMKRHHDRWYETMQREGPPAETGGAAASGGTPQLAD
jgi:formate dehydrogenase subunit gamma